MPEHHKEAEASNLNLWNILIALFKRKWIILLLTTVGLVAAALVFFLWPHSYESDAVLLVRYVLDRNAVDPDTAGSIGSKATTTNDTFINAEVAILKSWDLAVQVAEALGPKRVLPDAKGDPSVGAAAGAISGGLAVQSAKNSNVITVSYSTSRPEVATLVLNELVNRYFTKHLEVHRSAGAFDFVSQQSDQVRARLNQTEDALKSLKSKADIIDLKDSAAELTAGAAKIRDQLRNLEGELAEQRARVKMMEGTFSSHQPVPSAAATATASPSASPASPPPVPEPKSADAQQYQVLVARLERSRQAELEALSKYTENTPTVKSIRADIQDLEKQKRDLETKYPGLVGVGRSDLPSERARLAGLEAKRDILKGELTDFQGRIKQFMDSSPQIAGLERNKEMDEKNYKYFQGSLQKARIDEALDPSKMPNISAVQRASPPFLVTKKRNKVALVTRRWWPCSWYWDSVALGVGAQSDGQAAVGSGTAAPYTSDGLNTLRRCEWSV